MEPRYPHATVFVDKSNHLNGFYCFSEAESETVKFPEIGFGVLGFAEMDFEREISTIESLLRDEKAEDNFLEVGNSCLSTLKPLEKKHGYAYFFLKVEMLHILNDSNYSFEEKIDRIGFLFYKVTQLQLLFRHGLEFCLSTDMFEAATMPERFYHFFTNNEFLPEVTLQVKYNLSPIRNGFFDHEFVASFEDNESPDTEKSLEEMHRDVKDAVNISHYFIIEKLEEMIYLEFMEMVKRGVRVKRCFLCDQIFLLPDKRVRHFCHRIYENGRTCQQVGAKKKYTESISNDEYLSKMKKIYNKMYSRFYRMDCGENQTKKLSFDEFCDWSDIYSQARADYNQKKITGEEMIRRATETIKG
ncbi:MAG: DUF6076 domain-containing protein [Eubacteriales bacterium]